MRTAFEPCVLGTLRLKNRILRSATHEGMGRQDGMPTDDLVLLYEQLAAGGAGAIITGYAGVMRNGMTFANMRMFDDDRYMEVYGRITARLKRYGAPLILQLAHGGSRSHARFTGQQVIGPSFRRRNEFGDVCLEASEAQIEEIITAFVQAIMRAKQAGFDGIQLHAGHGYLLSEFISPALNRRQDRWGGALENRLRIVTNILLRARELVGDFPLLVKISALDEHRRGVSEDEAIAIVRSLRDASSDAVEISCGYGDFFNTVRTPRIPIEAILRFAPGYRELSPFRKRAMRFGMRFRMKNYAPLHNYNIGQAERIKKAVDIPIIVVGGIRSLQDITRVLSETHIDCVSLSRPFIIEPDIVERFRTGGQTRSRCIDCGYCMVGVTSESLRCYYGKLPDS